MSANRRIATAVGVSWFFRTFQALSNMILLPVMARHLSGDEYGLWMLLVGNQAFLALLTLGFSPVLTRHIALAKGLSGAHPDVELTAESRERIGDLVTTGGRVLKVLSLGGFGISAVVGYFFLRGVELRDLSFQTVLAAWVLLSAGYSIGVWLSYLDSFLNGMGHVAWNSLINGAIAVATVVLNIVVVLAGGGLVELAVTTIVLGILQRVLIRVFVRLKAPHLAGIRGRWRGELAREMAKPSLLTWTTSLGAFMIYQTNSYFIALAKGAADVGPYRSAYALVGNLYALATPIAGSAGVFVSQMWRAGNLAQIHAIVFRNTRAALAIMGTGIAFLLVSGSEFLDLWLGPGKFVGYPILACLCAFFFLDAQHNALSTYSRATEDERYLIPAISAGVLNLALMVVLYRQLGLLGIALATTIAQAVTSNWYAVYRPLVRLSIPFGEYFRRIALFALGVLGGTAALCLLGERALDAAGITRDLPRVAASLTIAGASLALVIWGLVLDRHHRAAIIQRVRRVAAPRQSHEGTP